MRTGATLLTALVLGTALAGLAAVGIAGAVLSPPGIAAAAPVDIPPHYLLAYRSAARRFGLGEEGWSFVAAIGKIESDHGRSRAPGVRSGQNAHGCCAGPMQIHNGFGSGAGTWGAFEVDGDGDGRTDIYDIEDAAATAARYLAANGAPTAWRDAIFAYNHAGWYVEDVVRLAAEYRADALVPERAGTAGPLEPGDWLVDVPGFPGERCDRRIVADVLYLTTRYALHLTDCFGGEPHARNGEHPLGLAVDLVAADGNWSRALRLATDAGWSPSCASSGCPGRGPFRVVLYNGFPGHGDPRFTSRPHLHVSWAHGPAAPFSPAPWVHVIKAGAAGAP
jgi:hypothetical protein